MVGESKTVALAEKLFESGQTQQAVTLLRDLLVKNHDDYRANYVLGVIEHRLGDIRAAEAHFRKALSVNSACGDTWYALVLLSGELRQDDISRMQSIAESADLDDRNRMLIAYALGIALDQSGHYDASFEISAQANEIQSASSDYSIEDQKAVFARHRKALDKELVEYCSNSALSDNSPILVLGMPRSGTTLVEQILGRHPLVHAAGEVEHIRLIVEGVRQLTGKPFPEGIGDIAPDVLANFGREYIDALQKDSGTAKHITDKLPHNFLRIGFFAAVLPRVKLIVCQRHPVDNCLSIYQHHFVAEHGYATDLACLGQYYNMYSGLVDYWEQLVPRQILRVEYEKLVGNPDAEIRRLLEHCDLEFHADCLSFHESNRIILTPSASQVRKPIYTGAVGRSAHYAKYLHPLLTALAQET